MPRTAPEHHRQQREATASMPLGAKEAVGLHTGKTGSKTARSWQASAQQHHVSRSSKQEATPTVPLKLK